MSDDSPLVIQTEELVHGRGALRVALIWISICIYKSWTFFQSYLFDLH